MHQPRRTLAHVVAVSILLAAVAVPRPAVADELPPDAPYRKVLVIFLSDSFDIRRYFETEIVNALAKYGATGVRSTSMMDTRVPMARETFLPMIDEIDADAVLVTQLVNLQTKGTMVDMNPQSTYNVWPTWYFNVWQVELTEYVEPQGLNLEHDLSLTTQLFSVQSKAPVWHMQSHSNILVAFDEGPDYSIFVDEATDIVKALHHSDMIDR